ncbi:MAG: hypothetical protein ACOC9W_05165 [Persicimonas sp.]
MSIRRLWPLWIVCLAIFMGACGTDAPTNEPPTITVDVGTEADYVVGEDSVRIQVTAHDPDGDPLSFSVVNKPERAELQTFASSALFLWDPISSDVTGEIPLELIFVAEDSEGAQAETKVLVTIRPGNGLPRFSTPTSKIYDPSSDRPLEFEVEVRDDDSSQVQLSMPQETAPEGASFAQIGEKIGEFSWTPNDEQRSKRVHAVTFIADDGDNEPVTHKVSIIFKRDTDGGGGDPDPTQTCEDEPITHTPIGAQRILDDYRIDAEFSASAAAKYDNAYLFWATGDVMNDPDVEYESTEMKIDGSELRAVIPNLLLDSGQSEVVYYAICASDEDAADDDESGFICVPSDFDYSFVAYSPDESSCFDDSSAGDGFSNAAGISETSWEEFRTCEGADDFHQVRVGAGETVELYALYSLGQPLDIKLYDQAHEEQPDALALSSCYGIAYAAIEGPDSGEETWYLEVSGDDTPYLLTAFGSGGGGGECGDEHLEPNDTADDAVLVYEDYEQFDGMSICDEDDVDIYGFELLEGDLVSAELYFTHADGDLDASLYAPSQEPSVDSYGVDEAWSTDDDESLTHIAEESGIYHLLVATSDTPNTYDLVIETLCGDDDEFGSNNHDQASAAPISATDYTGLKLCADSPDWYERTGSAGGLVLGELEVVQGAQIGDVQLEIYDDGGNLLESATESNGALEFAFEPSSDGQYFYKVSSSKAMLYDLTLLE